LIWLILYLLGGVVAVVTLAYLEYSATIRISSSPDFTERHYTAIEKVKDAVLSSAALVVFVFWVVFIILVIYESLKEKHPRVALLMLILTTMISGVSIILALR